MAKKRRLKVKTIKCKMAKVSTGGKFDKVKIGSRWYRTKSGVFDIHPGSKTKVCAAPSGKGYTTFESAGVGKGRHTKLRLVPKR